MKSLRPFVLMFLPLLALAADPEGDGEAGKKTNDKYPEGVSSSDTAETALKKFSVAPGLRVDVWAAEPLLANPIAFCFDEKGRAYVAETYRRRTSTPDIRKHESWHLENLALRTVEDRLKFFQAKLPTSAKTKPTNNLMDFDGNGIFDYNDWGVEAERIKLVIDGNGTGKADQSNVFATVKATPVTGLGAGVAVRNGIVFHTCAPDLWRYDGEVGAAATKQESLLHGFAVHAVFGGHDMHGVKFGPDGKVYWTIADCGAHVPTKEGGVLACPDSGAVFRSDLDGSNAEFVAVGLRNPQSLAFNDLGDLFTGDNNADGGDKARWTHVVDGADYGWRIGWQFLKEPNLLGPWNSEGMWHLDVDKTHFAVLPPVGLIGHGPAGIAYYPGTGLPDSYREHFFYADFPGGVRSFKLTPRGASYTVENPGDILQNNQQKNMTGKLLWGLFPSDVQFGVDGGAYVLDWVQGWEKTGKGHIYRVHDPKVDASAIVRQTKKLLGEGMEKRSDDDLIKLFEHPDQRVRLAAQFEVVRRGTRPGGDQVACMDATLKPTASRLTLLHAIWALAATRSVNANLLKHSDPEIRAATAKAIGQISVHGHDGALIRLLKDESPRVRFAAAQALGKLGVKDALQPLFDLLSANGDQDAFIRHAAVVALAGLADAQILAAKAADASDAVRIGALLALRRQASPEAARFLGDKNPAIVAEAARAIHDGPIPAAWPKLAALAGQTGQEETLYRRADNANFILGTKESAQWLTQIAANPKAAAAVRLDAIQSLAIWNDHFYRNRVSGLWHDLPANREPQAAVDATAPALAGLFKEGDASIRLAAVQLAGALKATSAEALLVALVADGAADGKMRAAALQSLDSIGSKKLGDSVRSALSASDKTFAEAGRKLAGKVSPELAVQVNAAVIGKGKPREQQEALATIAAQPVPEADKVLLAQFDALDAGKLPRALWLDLTEAAAQRDNPELKKRLAQREAQTNADPLAKWNDCLEGGDSKRGKAIFAENAEAACMRCHKIKGEGGDVGPDLAGLNKKKDRAYILQSIVDPSAVIAPGFENVVFTMKDGSMVAGLLNAEDAQELTVASLTDGKKQKVKKGDVKDRMKIPSAMPPGLGDVLGKRQLRDVVEYLATMK